MSRTIENDRTTDVIHCSEVSKRYWCPRATYYRLSGAEAAVEPNPSIHLEMAFYDGNRYHEKWQGWLWDMGRLEGQFACLKCEGRWFDIAPKKCPGCGAGRVFLQYREVPLEHKGLMLEGNADAKVDGTIIEIKSIGTGSIRMEAPKLLSKYTFKHDGKTHTDINTLWRDIRRPFPAHLRQGMLYCFLSGSKRAAFLYEFKGAPLTPKEFVVAYDEAMIRPRLRACERIVKSLDSGFAPPKPKWAENGCATCSKCPYQGVCWDGKFKKRSGSRSSASSGRGDRTADEAEGRTAESARRFDRSSRPEADEAVHSSHSLDGLLERALGDS